MERKKKKRKETEILRVEITDTQKSLHGILCSLLYLKYGKVYEVETFSIEKLRKFPFVACINVNVKDKKY